MSIEQNGSLHDALMGNFDFTIKEIFSEAWELLDGAKLIIHLSFFIYIFIAVSLSLLFSHLFDSKIYYDSGELIRAILSDQAQALLSLPILIPVMAGIVMLAVQRASHKKIATSMIFNYYILVWPLVFASLLIKAAVILGLILLIIPGIYLSITFNFTIPLIIDKQLGIFEAMKTSFTVVSSRWWKFFGIYMSLAFFAILSIFTLGIGFVWVLPLSFLVNGVLYRRIFGYTNLAKIEDEANF